MNTTNVKILIRGDRVNSNEKASLALQVFIFKKRVVMALGILLPVKNWDDRAERVIYLKDGIVSRDQVKQWNDLITMYRNRANLILYHAGMNGQALSPDIFKQKMRDDSGALNFLNYVQEQIKILAMRWTEGTISHYNVLVTKLREFNENMTFADLTVDTIVAFEKFMRDKGLATNTIWRHHKDIRMFIRRAIAQGKNISNPYEQFRITKAKPNRIHLTGHEVVRLRDLYLSGKLDQGFERALRPFLFSCFTGLRISDVKKLKYADLMDGQLVFVPHKTRRYQKVVRVPLNETASFFFGSGKPEQLAFDMLAEPVTNRYLKVIAGLSGISKSISFHTSRHTFAMMFLEKGGKIEVLREVLGHADIQTTMQYVHELNSAAKEQIKLLD